MHHPSPVGCGMYRGNRVTDVLRACVCTWATYLQDTTEDEIEQEHLEDENLDEYTIGVRGLATVGKGHNKMIFSLVFTNAVWIEKVCNCVRVCRSKLTK